MNVKISVIIPYYNVKKDILFQCINSILQQDFKDFEIIIVNDGSNNFNEYSKQKIESIDNRISVINQSHQGVSAARNNGLKKAAGEYIIFIDPDDLIMPYYFSEAYCIVTESDADYVVGCVYHTAVRNPVVSRKANPKVIIKKPEEYKPFLINVNEKFSDGSFFGRGPVARIVKRSILEGINFQEDINLGEDIIWNLDVINKCDKIYMVQQIWYIYWDNNESVTKKYNPSIITLCEAHLNALIKRIDINNPKEIEAYCMHIGDFLYRFIFECYYGRSECDLPVHTRYILFCKLCKKRPWSLYQTYFSKVHCSFKIKIKCLLIKFRLLYWSYYLKDFINEKQGGKILPEG